MGTADEGGPGLVGQSAGPICARCFWNTRSSGRAALMPFLNGVGDNSWRRANLGSLEQI